jgi:hypothetical protein
MVLSDWLTLSLKIPSYTFESFFSPIEYRVGAHLAGIEGAVLAFVGRLLPEESAYYSNRLPRAANKNFFVECAKEALKALGEDCRITTHRKEGFFSRERLIAWKKEKKLEFRRSLLGPRIFEIR